MKNSKITEEAIISLAESFFLTSSKKIIKGIGDDTAVLKTEKGYQLFTSDILIEGTHFLLDKINPYDLGWKSMAVNISDIAAMGGRPTFAVLSIGINDKISYEWLESFYQGLSDCGVKYSASIVGGDTVYSKDSLVINIALLGETGKPIYRDNVKPGFLLISTGELGVSGAGLWVMKNRTEPFSAEEKYCLNKHTLPVPRVEEANFISARVGNLSMIDSSDGLYTSGKILCEKSGVGLELFGNRFQISENLKSVSEKANKNPVEFILYGGEDYELVLAMPETSYKKIREEYQQTFNTGLICIGKFTDKKNVINLNYDAPSGKNTDKVLDDLSYKHFL